VTTASRLQPVNLTSFVGGLNLRRNQFQLADNESPDMVNVDVDPRGGFYTRRGWHRWNDADITADPWQPRNAFLHLLPTGLQTIYVANNSTIWRAPDSGVFAGTGITATADPHGADFVAWGTDTYVACGKTQSSKKITSTGVVSSLGAVFSTVDSPVTGQLPQAEFIESHIGYMFVANTREGGNDFFSRVRWSHPNRPDAFRTEDFIDINAGGGRITGILSFQDHLLIFKESSIWALYGYNSDSWQLVRVSGQIGAPCQTAITKSETACYFYSASNGGGIYAYTGQPPVYISEKLRTAFEEIATFQNVFVSFANRRLWVSVPWTGVSGDLGIPTTLFVFDIEVGPDGAWTAYRSTRGGVGTVLDGAAAAIKFPLAAFWSTVSSCMVTLDAAESAYDAIVLSGGTPLNEGFGAYYRTRWLNAGWPELRKSWRAPTIIARRVSTGAQILVEAFRDYNESERRRSAVIDIPLSSGAIWGSGPDWGSGIDWGSVTAGGIVLRGPDLGHASAVQLKLSAGPAGLINRWGIDGIIMKVNTMRFST
jgi:hypothetical protein